MAVSRRLSCAITTVLLAVSMLMQNGMTAEAGNTTNYLGDFKGGVASILDSAVGQSSVKTTTLSTKQVSDNVFGESEIVMANVRNALNVRAEASEKAPKVGKLYKDCGGVILDRKDGWTKLQSGNVIGWASDEYLLFDDEATALANDVGKMIAYVDADTLRVRQAPGADASVLGLLPRDEIVEVLSTDNKEWVCIDYDGKDGYVSVDYVKLDFQIDAGETMEEIRAREKAEQEAKRYKNYGEYTTDADTTLLLAALIHCEAGGESYEGQVAVGAVVMNRVRSKAYPDTIHGVIYASGQFTPAMNGKVNRVYESGKIYESCIRAAEEALSGFSNVGDYTHFRRNNGRDGLVIGNHVFY